MYYDFCPNCGNTIGQKQVDGQTLVCEHCAATIGVVHVPKKVVVEQKPAQPRCPACSQYVDVKGNGGVQSFVAHFLPGQRKMCSGSGKPVVGTKPPPAAPAPSPRHVTSTGKDLSAYMTRDLVRVVACQRGANPTVEQLTLEYLDKADRVRLQIDALRDILGASFQMKPYPPSLGRPHLALWVNAAGCVVARKHDQGGYQSISDDEVLQVVNELRTQRSLW